MIGGGETTFRGAENSLAGGEQARGRDLHAGSLEEPAVNGFLDVHIGVAASVAHQIAQGGETRAQILLGICEREECSVFASVVDGAGEGRAARLDVVEAKSEDVGVPVD